MANQILKIGVVGGTGYTGVELLRLLAQHQHCELKIITSRQEAGTPVAAMFPNLRGHVDLNFSAPSDAALKQCDVVFFATPNGVAMQQARTLFDAGVKIIDIAADFRIKDIATWEKWYATKHACPELVAQAVYGLPEVNRDEIRRARIVANPGCYPTAVQLGFLPLVKSGRVDLEHLIADAKSGVSGAGRKAEVHTLFAEASDNFKAYGVPGHRHHPEISQGLNAIAGRATRLVFVPHLAPMIRGIHATLYAQLTGSVNLQQLYEKAFRRRAICRRVAGGRSSGNALSTRVEPLPHRRAPAAGRRHRGGAVGDRQSDQGRSRAGGAEHEHHVRPAGDGRTGANRINALTKKLKRMFGIAAPRMAVRAAIPWYLRWLGMIALAMVILFLSHAAYDFGKQFAGFDQSEADREVQRLMETNAKMQQELARMRGELAQSERQLQMERATYADLVKQMKTLTEENAGAQGRSRVFSDADALRAARTAGWQSTASWCKMTPCPANTATGCC